MLDFKITSNGDLYINALGDIEMTESICQAVGIRLRWFAAEWRLGPSMGFPYFEEVLVKNPNLTKIRHLLRDEVMKVEGVTNVKKINIDYNHEKRESKIEVIFCVGEDDYKEEVIMDA